MEYTLQDIAQAIGGKVVGEGDTVITGINSLEHAAPGEISFLTDRRYEKMLSKTQASAVILPRESDQWAGAMVIVDDPGLGYAKAAALFAPPIERHPGVSSAAVVHESARLGRDVSVYPHVYVGEDAVIEDHVVLFPHVFVGDRVRVGENSVLHPNVTVLRDCTIGKHVTIQAGSVIGSDGFGFAREGSAPVKIPQLGTVQIEDHVEIGAGNCIDRGALGRTWIQRGVKTDNLVHVAHNVVVGEHTMLVAQAGISGSVTIGSNVIIGGQVGVVDHVTIGDGAMIASQSGVAKSISPGEVMSGSPTIPHRLNLKASGLFRRLPEMNDRLRDLEKRCDELEHRLK